MSAKLLRSIPPVASTYCTVAGTKRPYSEEAMDSSDPPPPPANQFIPVFETFRNELDEHQERRERIVKTSRDITALSKKT